MKVNTYQMTDPNSMIPHVVSSFVHLSDMQKNAVLKFDGIHRMNVTKLSKKLDVHVASLSRCLVDLEEFGIVTKRKQGTNHLLELTATGKDMLSQLKQTPYKQAIVYRV